MSTVSSVRAATAEDLPAFRALLSLPADWTPSALPTDHTRSRYLLVCDAPDGGLAAAAIVSFAEGLAHLEALQLSAGHESAELEARVLGVAEALAAAFGCRALGVDAALAA